MAKTTIKITGPSLKEPKVRKDGVTEILFKISMTKAVPKGLESLGDSVYKVLVSKKTWNKFIKNNEVNKDTFYIIEGEPKAAVTSKGVPFITIVCFNIQAKPQVEQQKEKSDVVKIDNSKAEESEIESKSIVDPHLENNEEKEENKEVSKKKKFKNINWRENINEDELVEINVGDIDIDHAKHKHAYMHIGDMIGINSVVAVTKKDNGRYSLLVGHKAFASAKIYRDKQPIKAYIYDKSREEFIKEFMTQD